MSPFQYFINAFIKLNDIQVFTTNDLVITKK